MDGDSTATRNLQERIQGGDAQAAGAMFARHRARLRKIVRLRLDRRLQDSIDPSDVLQEAYQDYVRELPGYTRQPTLPVFLWLRRLTGRKLLEIHQRHLGTQAPAGDHDISLIRGALPEASSASLAAQLLGKFTSDTQAAAQADFQTRLQEVLNSMDPVDREILVLRHFEMLNNDETAAVLGITTSAASIGYIRALKRLKVILVM
jgi:RNA polymerase sigma-70 factor, ECF subfamily